MSTLNKKKAESSPKQEALEVVIAEMERSLAVLEQNHRQAVSNLATLRECVDTDDLTRLLRRGAFMRKLHNLLLSSAEEGKEVTLMMVDVDHFKGVNDFHGHQTGDVVLEQISDLIKRYLRPGDIAGRYGGEEIIVAVQASEAEAAVVAERIRKAVESHTMVSKSAIEFTVTLSVGVASTPGFGFEAEALIASADAALYRAKGTGRNRVVRAVEPTNTTVILACESAA